MKRLILLALLIPLASAATETRHAATVREFRKTHACPATGVIQATCKGYVVDHAWPLCAGGPDSVDNMRYQPVAESYKKDADERAACRRLAACVVKK